MLVHKSISRVIALYLIALLFVIFNLSNIRIGGLSNVIPLFDVMMVFYFAVFKQRFAMWFIFLMGIWSDALVGNILGSTALCYILSIKIFSSLNAKLNIQDNFQQIWEQFMVFCGFFLLLKWSLLSAFSGTLYAMGSIFIQFILSSFFYVVMHKFFDFLSTKLLEDS